MRGSPLSLPQEANGAEHVGLTALVNHAAPDVTPDDGRTPSLHDETARDDAGQLYVDASGNNKVAKDCACEGTTCCQPQRAGVVGSIPAHQRTLSVAALLQHWRSDDSGDEGKGRRHSEFVAINAKIMAPVHSITSREMAFLRG